MNVAYNMDCLAAMREMPDKAFNLAVVDPPYGININNNMGRRKGDKKSDYKKVTWDSAPPNDEYFKELFRVSDKVIIWGGNYFSLPPTKCFLVWRKPQISEDVSFSMLEFAWTNIDDTSKEYIGMSNEPDRIHPTQKPVALYRWIFQRYAKPGDKILDTHLGSGSSRIAAYDAGLDFVGYEIDKEYFDKQEERFAQHTAQLSLFEGDYRDRKEGKTMTCPFCGSDQHRVLDSRPQGNERQRVRECLACGKRFYTVERWSKEEAGRIRCGTCHWYDEFSGVCCNGDSPHCADFTDDDHLCPLWAEGPPWKNTERKESK